uniref:IP05052p n=1 Tax=Drosophila melanogaster TaxID=7227 RepID=Q29QJ1_DROME|nr:IP05052p [Drosophila melanogaster]
MEGLFSAEDGTPSCSWTCSNSAVNRIQKELDEITRDPRNTAVLVRRRTTCTSGPRRSSDPRTPSTRTEYSSWTYSFRLSILLLHR